MIAGIYQIKTVDPAVGFGGARFMEQEAGVVPVGREAGGAFVYHPAVGNRQGVTPHFRAPSAVKGGDLITAGQIRHKAHEFPDGNRGITGVFQYRPAGHGGIEQCKVKP